MPISKSEIHSLIAELKQSKLELLERAYAIVDPHFLENTQTSLNQQEAKRLFYGFCKLCFEEIGAKASQYADANGMERSTLSRWVAGYNSPPAHTFREHAAKIYEFTKQHLNAG